MSGDMKSEGIRVCCSSGSVKASNYQSKGKVLTLSNGINAYHIGQGDKVIFLVYDIFGFDIANTRHFADLLSECTGCQVLMPDFFRGKPWPLNEFPPKDMNQLISWIEKDGSWDMVHKDLQVAEAYMSSQGCTGKFGIVGFCWGGKQAIKACALSQYGAGMVVHGSFLGPEDAEDVQCPMVFCPSGEDPPITPLEDVLKKKAFGSECVYKTFKDMVHGFAAARGDWDDAKTKEAVEEVLTMARDIFKKHL